MTAKIAAHNPDDEKQTFIIRRSNELGGQLYQVHIFLGINCSDSKAAARAGNAFSTA
jgi:hypothetical protein